MPPQLNLVYDTSEYRFAATISAQGLRNEMVKIPKPKDEIRILAIGDSFTFGQGVETEDTWQKILEERLKEKNLNVAIINAGVPGIDLRDDRLVCWAYKDRFDIDAIILGISNDDLYQSAIRKESTPFWQQYAWDTWPTLSRIKRKIIEESDIGKNLQANSTVELSNIWRQNVLDAYKKNPQIIDAVHPKLRSDFLRGKINPFLLVRSYNNPRFLTYVLDQRLFDFALSALSFEVEKFRGRCSGNTPVLVIFFPSSSLVSDYYHPFINELGLQTDPKLSTFDIDSPLGKILTDFGFRFLSPLTEFRRDGCRDCFFPYDEHMTSAGHLRIADLLLPQVTSLVQSFE